MSAPVVTLVCSACGRTVDAVRHWGTIGSVEVSVYGVDILKGFAVVKSADGRHEWRRVHHPNGFAGFDRRATLGATRARYSCRCGQKWSPSLADLTRAVQIAQANGQEEITLPLRFDGRLTTKLDEGRPRRLRAGKRPSRERPS